MAYSEKTLLRVRELGLMASSPDDVVKDINPEDPKTFLEELSNENTVLSIMYQFGLNQNAGQTLDIELLRLQVRKEEFEVAGMEQENSVYQELFGL